MIIRTSLLTLTTVMTAGCITGTSPNHDAQFGDSARAMRAQQLIDPQASTRNTGRGTTDGKAAAGAYKNYVEGTGYVTRETSTPPPQIVVAPTTGKQ
jgi:hypothetical protein